MPKELIRNAKGKDAFMTRDFEKTIRSADPSLDIRVCVEHGSIFIYQGSVDSRLYDWDDLIIIELVQASAVIAALQEASQILAATGGPV
jgi:hypothetical protein